MSQIYGGGFVNVQATGVTQATSGTSAAVAIPVASDGNRPRFIRVSARNESYVKLGLSGVVATANDMLIQPADREIMAVPMGITHIAVIQGIGAGVVNIVPLENI